MSLTTLEREVITDSMLKIQSIQASLDQIGKDKLSDIEEIDDCLKAANKSFTTALRTGPSKRSPAKR